MRGLTSSDSVPTKSSPTFGQHARTHEQAARTHEQAALTNCHQTSTSPVRDTCHVLTPYVCNGRAHRSMMPLHWRCTQHVMFQTVCWLTGTISMRTRVVLLRSRLKVFPLCAFQICVLPSPQSVLSQKKIFLTRRQRWELRWEYSRTHELTNKSSSWTPPKNPSTSPNKCPLHTRESHLPRLTMQDQRTESHLPRLTMQDERTSPANTPLARLLRNTPLTRCQHASYAPLTP